MGSDYSYQQIPHRKQFPVPPVYLPEPLATTTHNFMVSHPIDMGDLAFIFNLKNKNIMLHPKPHPSMNDKKAAMMPNFNLFGNICLVNYVLAGVQNSIVEHIDHCWRNYLTNPAAFPRDEITTEAWKLSTRATRENLSWVHLRVQWLLNEYQ